VISYKPVFFGTLAVRALPPLAFNDRELWKSRCQGQKIETSKRSLWIIERRAAYRAGHPVCISPCLLVLDQIHWCRLICAIFSQ